MTDKKPRRPLYPSPAITPAAARTGQEARA